MLIAMSGNLPGAIAACLLLLKRGGEIDPDSVDGGVMSLLSLDTLGIYEDRIWAFYKDVCGEHVGKMIAVLRAIQLGELGGVSERMLNHAIDHRGRINLDAVVEAVKNRLPSFQPEAAAA